MTDELVEFVIVALLVVELRNPLDVARGRLTLAQDVVDSEQLDIVAEALERMDALIEDILTIARLGQSVDETAETQLADAVMNAWETTRALEGTS